MPTKHLASDVCAICGQVLILPVDADDDSVERVFKLSCDHKFHEFCIRGWCIVGKYEIELTISIISNDFIKMAHS